MKVNENIINASLIGHYFICPRKAWLYSRQINPDPEHTSLDIGRYLQESAYAREKKEVVIDNLKYDILSSENGTIIVGEVKKSMRLKHSSLLQLGFYLLHLEEKGISAVGELRFPMQKQRERVELTTELRNELKDIVIKLQTLVEQEKCPQAERRAACSGCAYLEYCWC